MSSSQFLRSSLFSMVLLYIVMSNFKIYINILNNDEPEDKAFESPQPLPTSLKSIKRLPTKPANTKYLDERDQVSFLDFHMQFDVNQLQFVEQCALLSLQGD